VSIALGKETMAGQIRRLSSQEAMRRAKEIAHNLEQMFDVEDIDVVDMENGTVEIFAVSDDFENMDPKSKFSWNGYKYGLKSLNEVKSGDIVVYNGKDHTVQGIKNFDGDTMVSIRPKTKHWTGAPQDAFWVKPEDLNEDEIPSYLAKNVIFGKAVEDSVSFNDFQDKVKKILGPKYYKLTDQEVLKNFYDSVRVTKPNLEEETDTDVGGSAKPPIGLDIDDAHSGDAALDNEVNSMFEEDLTENTANWSPAIVQSKKDKSKYFVVATEGKSIQAIDRRALSTKQVCSLSKEEILKRVKNLEKDLAENVIKEFEIDSYEVVSTEGDLPKFCAINESKEFNFNKMIKEALTPNFLK